MTEYTDKKFWDSYFYKRQNKLRAVESVPFTDIFERYLDPDSGKTILEIGCADSDFLCYLAKRYGYKAYGIDYSDAISKTADIFKFNNLAEPTLYKEDFFNWNPDKQFDVVCSFGFIEHFENLDTVIAKHAELVSDNGKIIITLPHFAHGQYLLHWLIDRENLKKHNTKIMNLNSIRGAIEKNNLKIEHLSYYKTFGFWTERENLTRWEKIFKWMIIKSGKVITKIFGYDNSNFLFSPHIVCVAVKS